MHGPKDKFKEVRELTAYQKVDVEHPQMEPEDDTEVIRDVYDTELKEGDTYFINQYGEIIHAENLERYVIEENLVTKYTR